ncbi:hypothetical protein COU77_00405 [Candidatus Peregrinibacteria bacterium CG10_big_fil_rev_8_21_14_0_10_49_16]|nr:MAG: hypothetical protein COW95_00420 [Candidatus Peregrinibacteria bacterium CG22_combo_CG10-13_8_21_14_all_49_11]PIR52407.1 MAG: hypothetical protein COU77_00405 [Candidatus Peregrinibacteria bacterium CG10_big_fil_rev_8_21_14_0_10_49_16]
MFEALKNLPQIVLFALLLSPAIVAGLIACWRYRKPAGLGSFWDGRPSRAEHAFKWFARGLFATVAVMIVLLIAKFIGGFIPFELNQHMTELDRVAQKQGIEIHHNGKSYEVGLLPPELLPDHCRQDWERVWGKSVIAWALRVQSDDPNHTKAFLVFADGGYISHRFLRMPGHKPAPHYEIYYRTSKNSVYMDEKAEKWVEDLTSRLKKEEHKPFLAQMEENLQKAKEIGEKRAEWQRKYRQKVRELERKNK